MLDPTEAYAAKSVHDSITSPSEDSSTTPPSDGSSSPLTDGSTSVLDSSRSTYSQLYEESVAIELASSASSSSSLSSSAFMGSPTLQVDNMKEKSTPGIHL